MEISNRVSFWYGMGFAGSDYYMRVDDGNDISLGMDENKAREMAHKVLGEVLGIEVEEAVVVWKWDGTL